MLHEQAARFASFHCGDGNHPLTSSFFIEISRGLAEACFSASDRERYRAWAFAIGKKRIEGIVTNQHRGAYDRAATVLGILAECLIVTGKKTEAIGLVHEYCKVRFNRYSAFRSEVRGVLSSSPMLRHLAKEF